MMAPMTVAPGRRRFVPTTESSTVTPIELYFDLVFVFALTQVTAMMAADLTPGGVVRGMLVLVLLWWSWVGYAWLCNVVRTDTGPVRLVLFAAMAALFVLALSIPEAFDDLPGGLPGPVVVAVCYFFFRLMHLAIFWLIAADDPGLRRQLLRFAPSVLGGTTLLLVAARLDGAAQTWMWAAALLADYVGTLLGGAEGWRLRSPGHFAERHGLILIVALGESIVAIGVGVSDLPVSGPVVLAAVLGLVLASSLWWAYFDLTSLRAEEAFEATSTDKRAGFARDAYSYLHLPMLAGVILTALGLKKVLEYVGDTEHHSLSDALPGVAMAALLGGVILYLLGQLAFSWRTTRTLETVRLVAVVAAGIVLLAGGALPALAVLGVVTTLLVAMLGVETVLHAEEREELHGLA